MNRKEFLHTMALVPLAGSAMTLHELNNVTSSLGTTPEMPVLFLGHGSPMNAIEENEFVTGFRDVATKIPKPHAILCVSAHWETRGTFVTAMPHPKTIHDFGGFPKALFDVQYPAPGSPELAQAVRDTVTGTAVGLDEQWGLDHGAWSVIKHMYPAADVPVIQLSIDYTMRPDQHYALAQQLASLRSRGVLVIGSGNMVHNLGMVAWDKLSETYAYDWATDASERMKHYILTGDHKPLIDFRSQGRAFDLSIPTPEHYLPLLYSLGLRNDKDEVSLFNDKPVAGSLSMTSVLIGNQ